MDKSQLRRLAIDYAQGHLDHEGYVRERTELIDAIVSGRMPIERETPRQPKSTLLEEDSDAVEDIVQFEPGKAPRRLSPLHISIGGVLIALLAMFLFTVDDEPETVLTTDPPKGLLTPVDPPPASQARELVDDFVAANSWGTESLHAFSEAWQSLSESERNDAKAAPWFRPLTTALKQEINAQRAIAGLDDSESTRAKGRRLVSFAKSLGLVGPFPSFESDNAASSSPSASHNATDESNATTTAKRNVETSQSESNAAAPPTPTTISNQPKTRSWSRRTIRLALGLQPKRPRHPNPRPRKYQPPASKLLVLTRRSTIAGSQACRMTVTCYSSSLLKTALKSTGSSKSTPDTSCTWCAFRSVINICIGYFKPPLPTKLVQKPLSRPYRTV